MKKGRILPKRLMPSRKAGVLTRFSALYGGYLRTNYAMWHFVIIFPQNTWERRLNKYVREAKPGI